MPAVGGAVKIENGQTMNAKSAGRLSSTQLIKSITLSKPTGTQEQATNVTNQDSSGLLFIQFVWQDLTPVQAKLLVRSSERLRLTGHEVAKECVVDLVYDTLT